VGSVSRWYRAYEGTVTDAKLAEAAAVADVKRAVSIAAWHCLLESAAAVNNCGSYEMTPRRVSIILCEPTAEVEALFAAYVEIGLIKDGVVLSWRKRQHESDSSTERTRKWREKKRQETGECDGGDGDETSRDAPETETETETEELEPEGSCASGDALKPEHVVSVWNDEIAPALGKPKVRLLTPERRVRLRARIAGFTVAEFREVIANIMASPFLRGDTGWHGFSFDWFTKKANFLKILEGNYNGKSAGAR
jgi:hypothetical protein